MIKVSILYGLFLMSPYGPVEPTWVDTSLRSGSYSKHMTLDECLFAREEMNSARVSSSTDKVSFECIPTFIEKQ
jgi:hypothetical protein